MDVAVKSADFRSGFKLPSLLTQLQSILHQYPDDGQILKELIQNAEDAGAKRVVFLLDHTSYPDAVDRLHHPEMKLYQGPALYCYNDAVFEKSDDRNDWDGIRMISDSIKRNNPMKVGRFGLGFKSVFHMTDLPCIFSGEDIGFLDPHEQFFQIETGRIPRPTPTSSYLWNLESDKEYIRQKIDQFSPFFQNIYKLANDPCSSNAPHDAESVKFSFPVGDIETSRETILNAGYFDGSLFRFPLRVKEMQSKLSSTLYTPQKVLHLFDSLKADAHKLLLFLKSIETIEVYEKLDAEVAPTKLMEIGIQQGSRDVVAGAREKTIAQIEERRQEKRTEPVSIAFEMSTQFVMWSCIEPQQDCNTYASSDRTTTTETKEWVISHYFAGEGDLADGGKGGNELGFLPWVAVAQPLQVLGSSQPPPYMDQPKGQIFCFLPLPLENESPTGFQFHVHGYFAMDQNRRHIKKRTAEQIGIDITDQSLLWNEYLIRHLMPKALKEITTYLANSTSLATTHGHDLIYSNIPNLKFVKEQWKPVGEQFMKLLPNMRVFYSEAGGGKLVKASEARFDDIDDKRLLQGVIRRVLLASSVNLVSVPSFVLEQLAGTARQVSASEVCHGLKSAEGKINLTDDDRMMLLIHLASCLDQADIKQIVNTKLLPLSDDTWTEFKPRSIAEEVFIDSAECPRSLLPGLDHLFIRSAAVDIGNRLVHSGVTQLVILDQMEFAVLIRQLLQPYEERLEINVTELKWFSIQWLNELWLYLTKYHGHLELSTFDEIHILPGSNETLLKLSKRSAVVVRQCLGRQQLDRPIAELCKQLGLTVIETLPDFVANHPNIWGEYVQRPDGTGIITALSRLKVDKTCVVSCFNKLGEDQKDTFRDFISRAALSDPQLFSVGDALLRQLPMFRVVPKSTNSGRSHVSICDVNTAAPVTQLPVRFRHHLLDASNPLVGDFLLNFGIKPLSVSDALVDYVFPSVTDGHYGVEDIVGLMEFVFNHWSELEQNPQVANHLLDMKFVSSSSGQLCSPCDLFDQSDIRIKQLFGDEDVYPCGVLAESKYRHILKQLRLKGAADITADDILDIARKLEVTHSPERTSAMMEYLESNTRLLSLNVAGESLLNKLKSMRWVALKQERPDRYPKSLEFGSSEADSRFNRPQDIISSKYVSLVGSVRPIVDTSSIGQLSALFNWIDEPPIQQVVSHLLNVISAYDQQQNVDSDNDSCSATRKSCDDQAEFHSMLKHIYSYLDRHISEFEAVAEQLTAVGKWVWYFNGFAEPSEMVLQKSFRDLEPFVFVIPANFVTFRRLWQRVGIEDNCNLVEVMNRISKHHSDPERVFTSEKVKRDLDISVCILNEIARSPERGIVRDQLQVPVKTNHEILVLKPIDDCTYCDEEWYQKGFDVQHIANNPDIDLIHPSISIETAEALGIHSICSRLLDAEELDYESFGQSEPLTRRLKNILHDYKDGLAVIKELIQNADDAGATEVKFLYDQRKNKDFCTKLIDPGMKQVQGPALWAYNNAMFSKEDFDNLVKLNGATKELCKNKVGRFGLGFNAVYNLTDVPSLVSNGHVVFLDPHTTHLNRAIRDKSKPGIKIDIVTKTKQRGFFDIFKDQFEPFNNIFGCNFQVTESKSRMTSYPGTLFRFPLRSKQQSKKSDISNKHYNHKEVCSLLGLLAKNADKILLFTQSVKEVSLYHLSRDESCPQNMELQFTITKRKLQIQRAMPGEETFAFLQAACKLFDGYSRGSEVPQLESSAVIQIEYKRNQNSKANLSNNITDPESYWLVTSCIGRDKSFLEAAEKRDLISVGGVAALLIFNDNGHYIPSDKLASIQAGGTVFCFMPLPISSLLPVHINGYFAVTSSRMHLVDETVDDKKSEVAAWNRMLMEDAVTQAYVILLQDLVKLCPSADPYCIWPGKRAAPIDNANDLFGRMINAVYTDLCRSNGPEVFKGDSRVVNISQCKFLDADFRASSMGSVALSVFRQVKSEEIEVIDLPPEVMNAILMSSAKAEFSQYLVDKLTFFEEWFLPNISKATADERDQLVADALFDDSTTHLLSEHCCIPVKPNGVLKLPSSLIHPDSDWAILYDEGEERFPLFSPKNTRKQSDHYDKLVGLGMKKDDSDMQWEEIAACCKKVHNREDIALKRIRILLRLISQKTAEEMSDQGWLFLDQITKTRFLPALRKPTGFSLPWKGDECSDYLSCEEAYLSSEKYVVCCSFPLIDDRKVFSLENIGLKAVLHLNDKPIMLETVLHQLNCVLDKTDETGKIKEETRHEREMNHIAEIVHKVYSFLEKYVKNSGIERCLTLFEELRIKKCIFLERAGLFLSPQCCCETSMSSESQALLPYLSEVPIIMKTKWPSLLKGLKIKDKFTVDNYIAALQGMRSHYEDKPLSKHDLTVAAFIINRCFTELPDSDISRISLVYIPNRRGVLYPATSLCYSTCMDESLLLDDTEFCHSCIQQTAAFSLGVKTLKHAYLDRYAIDIPFGQEEKLVARLQRIFAAYQFEIEILNEMLHIADDTGATVIHFILDKRQLPTDNMFDESWKPLQGPALCVYNNKPITRNDIEGIQKLGEDSKGHDPTTTGQYGVGFNSVYHVTDVPMLLTYVDDEETLCIFDPNCKFFPGTTHENPGKRIPMQRLSTTAFRDVLSGFMINEYGKKKGTIFRLPLRNAATAALSELSNKQVTVKDIQDLFKSFERDMHDSMLFLNSIEEVHLRVIEANSDVVNTVYSSSAKLTCENRLARGNLQLRYCNVANELKSRKKLAQDIVAAEAAYEIEIIDSKGVSSQWLVVQKVGFDSPDVVPPSIRAAYAARDLGLLPRGGLALRLNSSEKFERKSRLFRFLPLPIIVDLPVHVNGQFSFSGESERQLWHREAANGYRTDWNTCLMNHVIVPAYCSLLQKKKERLSKHELDEYYAIFPTVPQAKRANFFEQTVVNHIQKIAISVYERISSEQMTLLAEYSKDDSINWLPPLKVGKIEGHFDDLEEQLRGFVMTADHEIVREVLTASGFILFRSPMTIYHNFIRSGVNVQRVLPETVMAFFSKHRSSESNCVLKRVDVPITETVFKNVRTLTELLSYCADSPQYKTKLVGLPFLVTRDCYVRQFDVNDLKFEPRFAAALPHVPQKFIHEDVFEKLKLNSDEDANLCSKLQVSDLVNNLGSLLNENTFRCVSGTDFIPMRKLVACLNRAKVPKSWLADFWRCLSSLVESTVGQQLHVINAVKDWCLLPAQLGRRAVLFTIFFSRCVIPINSYAPPDLRMREIQRFLAKLNIPQPLDKSYFSYEDKSLKLYAALLGSLDDAFSVVNSLAQLTECTEAMNAKDECLALLSYLTENLRSWARVPDAIATLQKLPLYCTVKGKHVSILDCNVYVIPLQIPTADMESWTSARDVVFLQNDDRIIDLLEHIGCIYQTETEVYCGFILPHFDLLSAQGRIIHLRFIKDKLLPGLNRDSKDVINSKEKNLSMALAALTECLHKLAFIPSQDGSLRRASETYDPTNDVFRVFFDESLFPSRPFSEHGWLQFLKVCGMIHVVTQDLFCSYAEQLARRGVLGVTDEVKACSVTLIKNLYSREDITDFQFLERVKQIAFIVPHYIGEVEKKMHAQFELKGTRLITLSGSISSHWADYVWTVQTVMPSWACPEQHRNLNDYLERNWEFVSRSLDIDLKPKPLKVAQHVNALCTKLSKAIISPYDKVTLKRVFENIYEFFQDEGQLEESIATNLAASPFVYDKENSLVARPLQVVVHYENTLRPYLIPLPLDIGKYKELFCELGATDGYKPTVNQYAYVFYLLYVQSNGGVLNPSECEVACRVMSGFFKQVMASREPIRLTEKELYLPGQDKKMHKSSEIVFDNKHFAGRLKVFNRPLLVKLQDCGLQFREYQLERSLGYLPAALQPQLISALVVETMSDDVHEDCDLQLARDLDSKIRSPQFLRALERLAWHSLSQKPGSVVLQTDEKVSMAVEGVSNVSVRGAKKLETILTCNGHPNEGSARESDIFCHEANTDGSSKWIVYVTRRGEVGSKLEVLHRRLGNVINKACNHMFAFETELLHMILRSEPNELDDLLNDCEIAQLHDVPQGESFRPEIGTPVPIEYHSFLRQEIQLLQPGTFAAMRVDDSADKDGCIVPTYILVKVVEEIQSSAEQTDGGGFASGIGTEYRVQVNAREDQTKTVRYKMLYAFAREMIESPRICQDNHSDEELPIDDSDIVAINKPINQTVQTQLNISYGASADSCTSYLRLRADENRVRIKEYRKRARENRTMNEGDRKNRTEEQFLASLATARQPGIARRWL